MSQYMVGVLNSGGGSAVTTLTGDSGGPVPPTAGNINIFGGTGIVTAGNPGTSTITVSTNGTSTFHYVNTAGPVYVVAAGDNFISVDCSANVVTVQLPNAPAVGRSYLVKDRTGSAAAFNITETTVGGVILIDGAATFVMNTAFETAGFLFNGASYEIW
jgi:hypothetical protein